MESIHKWIVIVAALLYHCKAHELSNRHLKIAYSEWVPFLMVDRDARCTGIVGELLNFMQRARNVTFTLVEEPGGVWGNCEDANNCTGMIGMVNRKEVDLALGMLMMVLGVIVCSFMFYRFFSRAIYYNTQQVARGRLLYPSVR